MCVRGGRVFGPTKRLDQRRLRAPHFCPHEQMAKALRRLNPPLSRVRKPRTFIFSTSFFIPSSGFSIPVPACLFLPSRFSIIVHVMSWTRCQI